MTTALQMIYDNYTGEERNTLLRAYHYAEQAHSGQKRASGEAYFIHPCAVAQILMELGLDCATIAAAFLHDVIEDTPATEEDIRSNFGDEVLQLVFPSSGVGLLGQFLQVVFQKKQALGIRPERKQQKQGEGEDSPEVFHGFHTVLLRQTKVRKRIGLTSKGERKSAKSRQVDINRPKEML